MVERIARLFRTMRTFAAVVGAALLDDESVSFGHVEPFDRTGRVHLLMTAQTRKDSLATKNRSKDLHDNNV